MKQLYIPRLLEDAIQKLPREKALVLFGARQVGKTTLIRELFDGTRSRWFSGDETEDVALLTSLTSQADLQVLLAGLETLIIDEAQRVPRIGLLLKRLVDARSGVRIVVIGSSALELAGGDVESAAGRFFKEELWPISIEELAKVTSWFDVVSGVRERLVFGNYPYVIREPRFSKKTLEGLSDSVIYKDIFSISGIRKSEKFQHLVKLLAYNVGSLVSSDRLAQECGLSAGSVANYIELLEQSFIVKTLTSYSRNLANELKKSKKVYFCDLGIRNAVIGDFSPFSSRSDSERGALWENFFVIERFKYHAYKETGAKLFFWRDKQKHEVDLVEVMPDASMRSFECKVTDESYSVPKAFAKKYPECAFQVATAGNFYRYFTTPSD